MPVRRRPGRSDHGQAAVEVALALPILVLLLLSIVQVVVVARDQIAVVHAARAAARAAAASGATAGTGEAEGHRAAGLDGIEVAVVRGPALVTATARSRSPTRVPIVGAVLSGFELRATATMAVED